ncbi:hypothetical protein ACTHAM_002351 [Cellulomonas soli]|uniref:hypothetical protein n=1 Tax=Cellulomonas soli TaxID=931535 RepID=UPI003F84240E
MSPTVFAVPFIPPPPPLPAFRGFGMTWTGWDGTVWDLTGGESEGTGLSLQSGVRGHDVPPKSRRFSSDSPALAGSRTRGFQVLDREVFWPLRVYSDASSQAWVEYDRAFWRTLQEDRPGVWTLIHPDGTRRTLRCAYAETDGSASDIDPSLVGWALYGINLVAEQPYWQGAPVVRRFAAAAAAPFIPEGGGPPFAIGEESTLSTATITNPGDVPSWVTWWVTDTDSLTIGVDGRAVVVPFEVGPGRMLVIDTSPAARTAKEIDAPPIDLVTREAQESWVASQLPTATDRTRELGPSTKWGPVPAGGMVDVSIDMVGPGSVRASLVPLHRRAW